MSVVSLGEDDVHVDILVVSVSALVVCKVSVGTVDDDLVVVVSVLWAGEVLPSSVDVVGDSVSHSVLSDVDFGCSERTVLWSLVS